MSGEIIVRLLYGGQPIIDVPDFPALRAKVVHLAAFGQSVPCHLVAMAVDPELACITPHHVLVLWPPNLVHNIGWSKPCCEVGV